MPASVYISFDAPGQVPATPRRLHAALSAVLDLPPGVSAPSGRRSFRRWHTAPFMVLVE